MPPTKAVQMMVTTATNITAKTMRDALPVTHSAPTATMPMASTNITPSPTHSGREVVRDDRDRDDVGLLNES